MGKACIFHLTLGLLMAFASLINSKAASADETDYVVYPSTDFEKLYLKLNRLTGVPRVQWNFARDRICNAIFKSSTLPTRNDVKVLSDETDTAHHIYSSGLLFRLRNNRWHLFEIPSFALLVNVSVLQTVIEETVFPCVVFASGEQERRLYLVSSLYDFCCGMQRETPSETHHGRFVFEYNKSRNLTSLVAVAEKPIPIHHSNPSIPSINNTEKEDAEKYLAAISERSRAICDFVNGRKLRLCTLGLHAVKQHLPHHKTLFFPADDRIEPQCENMTVCYSSCGRPHHVKSSVWAIGCKAEPIGNEEFFETHYISLGTEPHEFFIYKNSHAIGSFQSNLDEGNID